MNDRLKCKVCGRYFYQEATITSSIGFDFREKICPECKRARAFSGNGSSNNGNAGGNKGGSLLGGIAGGIASAAANKQANNAKRAEEEARAAERKARHEAAISAIKNFEFDESDDESFNRSATLFIEDYKTCHPGLLADNEYKKTYKQRIENEIKVLKGSNPAFAEKLSSLYEEAKKEMSKKLKKRLIIAGILDAIGAIAAGIFIAVDAGEFVAFFKGFGLGIIFPGAVLGMMPLGGITNKSKTRQEEQ